jgi:GcrA cell cycle regulator
MEMPAWTPEEIATLIKQWETKTATQIAKGLGHFTRSAVCGKASRLRGKGLLPHSDGRKHLDIDPRIGMTRHKRVKMSDTKVLAPPPPVKHRLTKPRPQVATEPCTLLELDSHRCRWPLGALADPVVLFCGTTPVEGLPYCAAHCAIAFHRSEGSHHVKH